MAEAFGVIACWGLGLGGFRIYGLGFRVVGLGFQVYGFGFMVWVSTVSLGDCFSFHFEDGIPPRLFQPGLNKSSSTPNPKPHGFSGG